MKQSYDFRSRGAGTGLKTLPNGQEVYYCFQRYQKGNQWCSSCRMRQQCETLTPKSISINDLRKYQ